MLQLARSGSALCLVLLCSCSSKAPPAPPPPEVRVVTAKAQSIENISEVPGRVQAVRTSQVRARVDGIVERRLYDEGTDVKAGQTLFVIDPREYRSNVSAVAATLTRAQATAANARQDVERYKGLVKEQAISQQEFDAAMARLRTADADVEQTQAQLESAKLNLSYTTVTAPIAGRAGRAQVTEGALVSAASATLLTTIEQLEPIYVNFSQSSAYLMAIRREMAAGTLKVPELGKVAVTLLLEDGSTYPHSGHLNFLDLSIDQATGTAAVRAEFPNPERILLPGQFVRARVEVGIRPHGFWIPQRAIQLSQSGATVMTIAEGDTVAPRPVKLGDQRGDKWIVLEGLQDGDRVVVDGIQKVQPGAHVRVISADEPAASAAKPAEQ
ncbi:MexX family efflux pump subunit [Steroidobacter agaridevorans]|uniref:MexX family efflux pump subunit n=1 Tax=Steroidobacter agaridevorans TaxID=2695856 RepID=A0A829YFB9_9GAMM|nr:efflux RND transporter periplasmic adaptor subunit [Steroidobacter agaridevorans]GFE81964.1 MexX family efflux pump subunit [Steroidobacter agaridevorans]GFE85647.1 MexX family efflux pump subunit [Steroidobacter agaridevorans]